MRRGLAQIALVLAVALTAKASHGQRNTPTPLPETKPEPRCPSLGAPNQSSSGPEIAIAGVSFSGALRMPVADQDQIAESVKQETRGTSVDGVTEEALGRVTAEWQNRGYFKVEVNGQARTLPSSPGNQPIALFVHVDEGKQYRLNGITFKNNKAISNVTALRRLFPINDGEIFSREKIAKGLENLRNTYTELGYINFASVPDTVFDDEHAKVSLEIDISEGKQFSVSSIDVLGLDEAARQEILKDFPVGQIYNARLFDLFLEKYSSIFPFSSDDPSHVRRRLDERAATVAITLDARPCPVD